MCAILCGEVTVRAQEMDKEISELGARLAASIKEHGNKKVTVLDFTDLEGRSSELGRYVAEQLTVELVMAKREFSVLDRANLKKILEEHELTSQGLVDPENAKKLGAFAGVDALILGNIIPKTSNVALTAKIITTETAEIVGAARAEFLADEVVKKLISQPTLPAPESADPNKAPATPARKPFGDLEARVESLKYLPGDQYSMYVRLTLIITNTSDTKTYGVAIDPEVLTKFNLINNRGDEFRTPEVSGIATAYERSGIYQGSMTDVLPKSAISIIAKFETRVVGSAGDFRPYRFQTVVIFGEEENGRHPNPKKHNLVIDIK